MKRWVIAAVVALPSVTALAQPPSEAQRVAESIEKALQRHGPDVHRCFGKALADSLDATGRAEVEVDVGPGGRVKAAKVLGRGGDVPPALATCVAEAAKGWTVEGIEPGASVVLPFAFEAQASQFVVKVADIPDRGPGAAPAGKPGTGPARQAAFTVKVLADEANVRAQNVSLTMLTVGPASRVAMHRHPRSGKALYVMRGRARVLGPAGAAPVNLTEGSVAFVPVGYPHVIENMGRQEPVVFLQIFAPPGPEKVYRNPKDPAARADFEVIRDPGKVKPPAGAKVVLVQAANTPTLPILNGKGSVKILLEPKVTGSDAFALNLIEFAPGAEVARHTHPGSTELLFVTAGRGTMTIGSEAHPFVADDVLHVPPDQPHASKLAPGEKTTAIQIYAPAGPEQRFRAGGTAQPGAAPAPPNPPSQR